MVSIFKIIKLYSDIDSCAFRCIYAP